MESLQRIPEKGDSFGGYSWKRQEDPLDRDDIFGKNGCGICIDVPRSDLDNARIEAPETYRLFVEVAAKYPGYVIVCKLEGFGGEMHLVEGGAHLPLHIDEIMKDEAGDLVVMSDDQGRLGSVFRRRYYSRIAIAALVEHHFDRLRPYPLFPEGDAQSSRDVCIEEIIRANPGKIVVVKMSGEGKDASFEVLRVLEHSDRYNIGKICGADPSVNRGEYVILTRENPVPRESALIVNTAAYADACSEQFPDQPVYYDVPDAGENLLWDDDGYSLEGDFAVVDKMRKRALRQFRREHPGEWLLYSVEKGEGTCCAKLLAHGSEREVGEASQRLSVAREGDQPSVSATHEYIDMPTDVEKQRARDARSIADIMCEQPDKYHVVAHVSGDLFGGKFIFVGAFDDEKAARDFEHRYNAEHPLTHARVVEPCERGTIEELRAAKNHFDGWLPDELLSIAEPERSQKKRAGTFLVLTPAGEEGEFYLLWEQWHDRRTAMEIAKSFRDGCDGKRQIIVDEPKWSIRKRARRPIVDFVEVDGGRIAVLTRRMSARVIREVSES